MQLRVNITRNKWMRGLLLLLLILCVWFGAEDIHEAVNILMYSKSNSVGSLDTRQMSDASNFRVFDTSVDYSNAEQIYKCVNLTIEKLASTPICVYDPAIDIWVSGYIISKGNFEGDLILELVKILQDNPSLTFLDIGCNVGVYTLAVAKFGRQVTAVDANRKNLEMVATSLVKGNLTEKVKLIWNAISDKEETVGLNHWKGNVGGLQMISGIGPINDSSGYESSKAIVLDNLVPIFRKKSLVIKMDIEKFELKAMLGGKKFFEEVDVRFLLMEWVHHAWTDVGGKIIQFMMEREYIPVMPLQRLVRLQAENRTTWPNDIMWIKNSNKVP